MKKTRAGELDDEFQAAWDEGYVQGFEDAKSRYWWKAFAAGWGLVGFAYALDKEKRYTAFLEDHFDYRPDS